MSSIDIGCCAAYCGTCMAQAPGTCAGCRIGYDSAKRDIRKARCAIKVCCLKRLGTAHTCADCPDCLTCETLQGMYAKDGYKYRKYKQSLEFIRAHGYERFLEAADEWKRAYGKLP